MTTSIILAMMLKVLFSIVVPPPNGELRAKTNAAMKNAKATGKSLLLASLRRNQAESRRNKTTMATWYAILTTSCRKIGTKKIDRPHVVKTANHTARFVTDNPESRRSLRTYKHGLLGNRTDNGRLGEASETLPRSS